MSLPAGEYRARSGSYAVDDGFDTPKEYFKQAAAAIERVVGRRRITLLDVGCAAGAFIHHARQRLNVTASAGMDVSKEYTDRGAGRQPDVEFVHGSFLDPSVMDRRTFDVCTCLGTMSIFDDLAKPLEALLRFVRPGGVLLILDLVNDHAVDMVMRYRTAVDTPEDWRPGFNVRSLETYRQTVWALDRELTIDAENFEMPFDIPRSADPMRAWTIATPDRPHQVVVGTGQLLNFKILTIRRP